jgi:CBS domain containing-hemolysin-like protein
MKFFRILFKPGIYVFNGSANRLTKVFGVEPASETSETYTEEELRNVINQSSADGQVDSSEVDMIERVFELDDFRVKDVMAPRPDTVVVYSDDKISEIVKKVKENTHTRYPVIGRDDESISGYVDIKDIFTGDNNGKTHIRDIKEDITIISESANIRRAIKEFKENNTQMLAVVDEWGVFEGIITVEDAIEVLVGDIRDKYDKDHKVPSIEEKEDDLYVSDGSVSVRRINKVIGTSFDSANSDTIAGVILNQTETIPNVGDTIRVNDYVISVEEIEDNRIQEVKISKNNK